MNKKDKELEFIRGREKLLASPVKSPDYTSVLNDDTMKVKGGVNIPDPVSRIKGTTQHFDTKQVAPIISGEGFVDKISRLKAMKKLGKAIPGIGAVVALASGEDASAAVPVLDQAENIGPTVGSFDDRLEKGQLTPEELEMLRSQYLNKER